MASAHRDGRVGSIVTAAERLFGQPVERITAPGGRGRASFRVHFADRTLIATMRATPQRTETEAMILRALRVQGADVPDCVGVVDGILFQSDAGRRVNQTIEALPKRAQLDVAQKAVAGIFRYQAAARRTDLHNRLPRLGATPLWAQNLVSTVSVLEPYSRGISAKFDSERACRRIALRGEQFVKWDCRSGNAAIGPDGRLRWFDFEYSGLRHGAEDFAWLIGDEAWPIPPEDMVDVMIDCFDPSCGYEIADYFEYLSVFLTFHCIQRLRLIVREANARGWLSPDRVRKYDDAGVHPEFAAQVCRVGRYFSAQSRTTEALTINFDEAMCGFERLIVRERPAESA